MDKWDGSLDNEIQEFHNGLAIMGYEIILCVPMQTSLTGNIFVHCNIQFVLTKKS